MTQTFGWFCNNCEVRYRASSCTDNKCPDGHSIENAYWVYKQKGKDWIKIIINGPDLKIEKIFSIPKFYFHSNELRNWINIQSQLYPEKAALFKNLNESTYVYPKSQMKNIFGYP